MSFLADSEHIVILEYNAYPGRSFGEGDLIRLRDVGVKTVICYLMWYQIETAPGVYDWSSLDLLIERYRRVGLKAIVKVALFPPDFFAEDWYTRDQAGNVQNRMDTTNGLGDWAYYPNISYWNPVGWRYHLDFIELACKRLSAPDVLCINISPANGEALIFGKNVLFDPAALASYRAFTGTDGRPGDAVPGSPTLDWMRATVIPGQIEMQRIFHGYGGEYWTMLHHAFETIPSTGNWLIDDLYDALHREFGNEHWGICYTVYRPGETRGLWGPEQDIRRHGVKMLIASEGPQGLLDHTRNAIDRGARGMLCGPMAPYLGYNGLEEWMVAAIRETAGWWGES
jgi:hypothetical protein